MLEVQTFSKPTDLKEWAYRTIKKLIISDELQVGEQLRIEVLSAKLGISRTPIREALLILEREGLVRVASRVGFFVRDLTMQDLRELFELREIIEAYAAEKAVANLSAEDLLHLANIHKESVEAVNSGKLDTFLNFEIDFHTIIIKNANNQRLFGVMESLKDLTYRERLLSVRSIENVKQSLEEHEQILEALKQRNIQKAGECMRLHIRNVKDRLIGFLNLRDH